MADSNDGVFAELLDECGWVDFEARLERFGSWPVDVPVDVVPADWPGTVDTGVLS